MAETNGSAGQATAAPQIAPTGKCPCCSSTTATDAFYRVENIPIQSCVLLETADLARAYQTRDLELTQCWQCGFIFNAIFDAEAMEYAAATEESQIYSGTFGRFAKQLIEDISSTYDLVGKHVVEIGCGKGDFLIELCSQAQCSGLGLDPGFRPQRLQRNALGAGYDAERVSFAATYFGPDYGPLEADLIVCRHTLEHIADVADFVSNLRSSIGQRTDVGVFFETPDTERILSEGAFWDIYYEHCSYFTRATHAELFHRAGFAVDAIELVYDDQYIIQYAHPADRSGRRSKQPIEDITQRRHQVAEFGRKVEQNKRDWQRYIRKQAQLGKRIVIWGGSSKTVAFLTTLAIGPQVSNVVDINPFKQGKYLPGTGHLIIAPSQLKGRKPDVVIVMNPIYTSEIASELYSLGLSPEIATV